MTGTRPRESAVDRIRERVEEKAARRAAARAAAERAERGEPAPDPSRPPPGSPGPDALPGLHAERPTQIPARGWKQIVKRAWAEHNADNMPIIAGGVAFFAFLAIFPALIATISIYGLVASPETVARQVEDLAAAAPGERGRPHRRAARPRSRRTAAARSPSAWRSRCSVPCGRPRAAPATSSPP